MSWFNKTLDWFGRFQTVQWIVQVLKPVIFPAALTMLTGAAGVYGHEPFMWIFVACALAFMGTVTGVFFAGFTRDRTTPEHKILYQGTRVNYDLTPLVRRARRAQTSSGAIVSRTLDKVQLGVILQNAARFPISVTLVAAETEMEGIKPPRSMFPRLRTH
jgi:hypothetical protein